MYFRFDSIVDTCQKKHCTFSLSPLFPFSLSSPSQSGIDKFFTKLVLQLTFFQFYSFTKVLTVLEKSAKIIIIFLICLYGLQTVIARKYTKTKLLWGISVQPKGFWRMNGTAKCDVDDSKVFLLRKYFSTVAVDDAWVPFFDKVIISLWLRKKNFLTQSKKFHCLSWW